MHKYLYLTKMEWVDPWVNGGEVPLFLASSYRSDVRMGTKTPDENLIQTTGLPMDEYSRKYGIHIENCRDFTIGEGWGSNGKIPAVKGSYYIEDGLILSLCNTIDKGIGERLGKSACIRILDVNALVRQLNKQLGAKGVMGVCQYTLDHKRDHFLKSAEDSWQDEYRIFWKTLVHSKVVIPKGSAEFVMRIGG